MSCGKIKVEKYRKRETVERMIIYQGVRINASFFYRYKNLVSEK